jgi:hypothetical protein
LNRDAVKIDPIIAPVCVGLQLLVFLGVAWISRRGLRLPRWTEKERGLKPNKENLLERIPMESWGSRCCGGMLKAAFQSSADGGGFTAN